MIANRSVPTDILLPHIAYPDVAEAVVWLSKTFGFTEHYRYGESGGELSGAQMRLGTAWIMLKKSGPGFAAPLQAGCATQSLTIFVADVDSHFKTTQSAGARIVDELHETVYGERQYGAEDFAGHHWLFSRHARDVNPSQWGAVLIKPSAAELPLRPAIAPLLSVRNGPRAIEFYAEAFDAQSLLRVDSDDGAVVAKLSAGGAEFWLADESPEHFNFSPESLGGGSVRMVMVVSNPDAVYQQAIRAGATLVWPVADQDYGWRVGRLVDPFGHHWEIGKPLNGSS